MADKRRFRDITVLILLPSGAGAKVATALSPRTSEPRHWLIGYMSGRSLVHYKIVLLEDVP